MSGFVYIWYDRKKKRFYIGSHWGSPDDGYVCSSSWMKQAYKNRPEDFKRRIIAFVYEGRRELLQEEQRWLQMILPEQVGKRYYNLVRRCDHHWTASEEHRKTVPEKISQTLTGRKYGPRDPSVGQNISKALKGRSLSEEHKAAVSRTLTGRVQSEETRAKKGASLRASEAKKKANQSPEFRARMSELANSRSLDTRDKIAENSRRLVAEGRVGMKGRKHSPETRARMAEARRKYYEEKNCATV